MPRSSSAPPARSMLTIRCESSQPSLPSGRSLLKELSAGAKPSARMPITGSDGEGEGEGAWISLSLCVSRTNDSVHGPEGSGLDTLSDHHAEGEVASPRGLHQEPRLAPRRVHQLPGLGGRHGEGLLA